MAIYAYLRLSTDESKQANSFDVQEKLIKEYLKANNLKGIDEVFKEAVSGGADLSKKRSLLELLNKIDKGDTVVVQKLDRLSRDALQTGWIRTEIVRKGAGIVIVESDNKQDPQSILMEQIITAFSQYEREMIKSRIKATMAHKRAKGEKLGGSVPYGYDVILRDGKKILAENLEEQEVISRIIKLRAEGMSLRAIVESLNESGVRAKGGTQFYPNSIKRILEYNHK